MLRRALIAKIKIKLRANYSTNQKLGNSPYDINKLRNNHWRIKRKIGDVKWDKSSEDQIWDTLRNSISKILVKYPLGKRKGRNLDDVETKTNDIIKRANFTLPGLKTREWD